MFSKNINLNKEYKSILLIQLGDIGDVVLTIPALKSLRERYPAARIYVAVRDKASEIIDDCQFVDGTIIIKKADGSAIKAIKKQFAFFRFLRSLKIEIAIELRTGDRGSWLAFFSGAPIRLGREESSSRISKRNFLFSELVIPDPKRVANSYVATHHDDILEKLGAKSAERYFRLFIPEYRKEKIKDLLKQNNIPQNRPIVAIHPFSLWSYKEWDDEKWINLANKILQQWNVSVIITGAPSEYIRASHIANSGDNIYNMAGTTTVGEFPALIEFCSVLIGVDTAAVHIATMIDTPSVALFGPGSTKVWALAGHKHKVLTASMSCQPCRQKGCDGKGGKSICLEFITVEDVFKNIKYLLDDKEI